MLRMPFIAVALVFLLAPAARADGASSAATAAKAAQDLTRLRPWLRTHYVQPNVGHYGVFSGRRWQQHIYPVVRNVIQVSQ